MESFFEKLRDAKNEMDSLKTNIQSNGTPVRTGTKMAREAIESSYGDFISSVNQVEQSVDRMTGAVNRFREKNAAMTNYCQVHPSTAIFGSAGVVAVPSYLGTTLPLSFFDLYMSSVMSFSASIAFGVRGMMLGALGTASFATLFVGALFFSQRNEKHIGRKN
jgi:hypothetical protein